ncbi:MAG: hypothetical protein KGL74_13415 [Elusimicrobia bacterium]|nr:hypothetical protein [Elusimicrobiota bacterium]MDE2512117.1 hypothetical protein [Elusimicrobiota bacterium]
MFVQDLTPDGQNFGSGVGQILVENPDGVLMAPMYNGEGSTTLDLSSLPEGQYIVTASDLADNETQVAFTVDKTSPVVSAMDSKGTISSGGITDGLDITISAQDIAGTAPASGLAMLEIFKGDPNDPQHPGTLMGVNTDAYSAQHTYTSTDPGLAALGELLETAIYVRATDKAGNRTTIHFKTSRGPQIGLSDAGYAGSGGDGSGGNIFDSMTMFDGAQGNVAETVSSTILSFLGNNRLGFALVDPYGFTDATITGPGENVSLLTLGQTSTMGHHGRVGLRRRARPHPRLGHTPGPLVPRLCRGAHGRAGIHPPLHPRRRFLMSHRTSGLALEYVAIPSR